MTEIPVHEEQFVPEGSRVAIFTGDYFWAPGDKNMLGSAVLRYEDDGTLVYWPLPLPPAPDMEMPGDPFAISPDGLTIYSLA